MIWLIVISTALILLWGSSEQWDLVHLWRRLGHALHIDRHGRDADHRG